MAVTVSPRQPRDYLLPTMLWGLSYREIGWAVGAFGVSTLVTTGIVVWFLVAIRPEHFVTGTRGLSRRIHNPVARALYTGAKNVLGGLLILVGIVLSLPGVPGQGLLTILVGVLLMDIPGKRRFELAIVRRPRVLASINRVRARFGRAPLRVDRVVGSEIAKATAAASGAKTSGDEPPDVA